MRYREFAPHPALRRWVRCYWELTGHGTSVETILPDGCTELVFHFGDSFLRNGRPQPAALFVGQMTGPVNVQPTGTVRCLGIRFEPMGAWSLTGCPQHRLENSIVEARELFDIREAEDRRAAIESTLLAKIPDTVDTWTDGLRDVAEFRLTLREFRAGTGVGTRQFERLFKERVGLTPVVFARLLRFHRALHSRGSWADIAGSCGYADQSHLIRDFREFAGSTPTNLPEDPMLMSQTYNTAGAAKL